MKKILIIFVLLVGFSKVGYAGGDDDFVFFKDILLSDEVFAESKYGILLKSTNDFDYRTDYGIFQPNSSGKKFYYYADCPTRWGSYFFLFSIENNQPVFHSSQIDSTNCMDKVSIEDKNADGVDELIILSYWYASGSGGEEEQIFFYKDEEFEIYRYPKREWQSLGIGGFNFYFSDPSISSAISNGEADFMGVSYGYESFLIIPDNSFPSDKLIKKKNVETYNIGSIDSSELEKEFIKKVSNNIVLNSNFEITKCERDTRQNFYCFLKKEY